MFRRLVHQLKRQLNLYWSLNYFWVGLSTEKLSELCFRLHCAYLLSRRAELLLPKVVRTFIELLWTIFCLLSVSVKLWTLKLSYYPQKTAKDEILCCANLPPDPQSWARNFKFGEYLEKSIAHKVTESGFRYHFPFVFYNNFCCFSLYKLENYAPSFKVVVWTRGHHRSIDETLANKVTDIDFRFMTIPPF